MYVGFSGLWLSETDFSLPWMEWWIPHKVLRSLSDYALAEIFLKALTVNSPEGFNSIRSNPCSAWRIFC